MQLYLPICQNFLLVYILQFTLLEGNGAIVTVTLCHLPGNQDLIYSMSIIYLENNTPPA